jgi:plastocyanin domain-containing protein
MVIAVTMINKNMRSLLNMKKIWVLLIVSVVLICLLSMGCNLTTKHLNLVNGTITVLPGSSYGVQFSVDTSIMKGVKVEGSFQASGGSGNDIDVLILDEMDFINWSNGHQVSPVYYSGQITIADINVPITQSGDYHLVFGNMFSVISSKNVSAQVDLHWAE